MFALLILNMTAMDGTGNTIATRIMATQTLQSKTTVRNMTPYLTVCSQQYRFNSDCIMFTELVRHVYNS